MARFTPPTASIPEANSLLSPSTVQFQPGNLNGNSNPVFNIVNNPYHGDYKNPAPNAGIAWTPRASGGFMEKVLGHDKTVSAWLTESPATTRA